MSYAGAGYIYGTSLISSGKTFGRAAPVTPNDVTYPEWNALKDFQLDAQNAVQQGDFHGLKDSSGGAPPVAPSGQVRRTSILGQGFTSRNGRLPRQDCYDYDVTEFGPLVPDSALSAVANTTTLQAAYTFGYNEAVANRPCRLLHPPGHFYIADGQIASGLGLLWKGTSAVTPELIGALGRGDSFDHGGTILEWNGTANGLMMYGQAINKGRCQDIFFNSGAKAGCSVHAGASVYNDWPTLAASAGYIFERCKFGQVKAGVSGNAAFKVGTDPALAGGSTLQSSDAIWRSCTFVGEQDGSAGFTWAGLAASGWKTLSGGNCKNFVLDHCDFDICNKAVDWDQGSGFLNVFGTGFADCMVQFQSSGGQLTVIGGDAEAGDVVDFQLLKGTGGGGTVSAWIQNFEAAGFMAGVTGTALNYAGHLTLTNVLITNANHSVSGNPAIGNPYKLILGGVGVGQIGSAYIRGCTFECPFGSNSTLYPPLYDGSGNWLAPDPVNSIYGNGTEASVVVGDNSYTTSIGATATDLKGYDLRNRQVNGLGLAIVSPAFQAAVTPTYYGGVRSGWTKITLPYTAFQVAATTKDINLVTFASKVALKKFYADVTVAFAGLAGTINLRAGYTGAGTTDIFADKDVKTAPVVIGRDPAGLNAAGLGSAIAQYSGVQPNLAGTWVIALRMTSGAGNLSGLNAGSVTLYVQTELL